MKQINWIVVQNKSWKNIAPNVSIKNVTDDHMLISTHGYDVFLSF